MPVSNKNPKAPKSAVQAERQKRMAVIQSANQLDRRRQSQINNQVATINRLLLALDEGKAAGTSHAVYTEEMKILHMAASQLQVENQDLVAALKRLVAAVDEVPGLDGDAATADELAEALSEARTLVTPVAG